MRLILSPALGLASALAATPLSAHPTVVCTFQVGPMSARSAGVVQAQTAQHCDRSGLSACTIEVVKAGPDKTIVQVIVVGPRFGALATCIALKSDADQLRDQLEGGGKEESQQESSGAVRNCSSVSLAHAEY